MAYHNGMPFSTADRDNDASSGQCTNIFDSGGWWYKNCYHALLTGKHSSQILFAGTYYPFAEMRLRPKNCTLPKEQSYN